MYDRDELKSRLQKGICKVTFTKANGETRIMYCTLSDDVIPPAIAEAEAKIPRKENLDVIAAWDIEKKDWRSFRIESVTFFDSEFNL